VSRATSSQLSFADWELMRQGLELEPLLQAIADFLDDHEELVTKIRGDLRRGLKKPDTGRNGLAPQEVLRSLVLMRVKNWDYRELRERIADGYTLRLFTGFRCRPVPKHNAFHRAFVRLTPATLRVVNDLMVKAAVDLGLEDGTKLRVDTTVVQTDIHYPTDSTLLWDAVRVLSHLLDRLGKLHERRVEGFRNRTRAARRRMQALQRMSATQRLGQQTAKYRELIAIAEEVVACARSALEQPRKARRKGSFSDLAIAALHDEIGHYCRLADRVIDQARRPRAPGRASAQCREDLLDLRAAHRPDQARQGAHTGGVRPQGSSRRECPRPDHAIPGAQRQSARRAACRSIARAPQEDLRPCSRAVRCGSWLLQRAEPDAVRAQRRQDGVHPAIRRQENP